MSFFSSLTKGFKGLGKTVANLFGSTSGLVTGGLGSDYLNDLGDTISGGLKDAWGDYTGKNVAIANLRAQRQQWQIQNKLNQDQFDYQVKLNKQQQEREDNAYQRKVADLKAAGLNPVLAAGGSGSASAPLSAPALKAPNAPQLGDYSEGYRKAIDQAASAVFNMLSMKKDFAVKDAQISLLHAQKDNVLKDTDLKDADIGLKTAEAELKTEQAAGQRTTNVYLGEYLAGRNYAQSVENYWLDEEKKAELEGKTLANEGLSLDNQLKSKSIGLKIMKATKEIELMDQSKLLNDLDIRLKELGITSVELENSKKIAERSLLLQQYDKNKQDIVINTVAILQKMAEYENYRWDTEWYHKNHNVPKGFAPGMFGSIAWLLGSEATASWNWTKEGAGALFRFLLGSK